MGCSLKNPAARRFVYRSVSGNVAYIVLVVFAAFYFHQFHPRGLLAYLLATLPAIAILGVIVSLGVYLVEEKDEFKRNLMVEALLWGLGGVLVFTSVWGALETFIRIPHFNATYTYTIFWLCVGVGVPVLHRRYR
jgi:hypothetical protein